MEAVIVRESCNERYAAIHFRVRIAFSLLCDCLQQHKALSRMGDAEQKTDSSDVLR